MNAMTSSTNRSDNVHKKSDNEYKISTLCIHNLNLLNFTLPQSIISIAELNFEHDRLDFVAVLKSSFKSITN